MCSGVQLPAVCKYCQQLLQGTHAVLSRNLIAKLSLGVVISHLSRRFVYTCKKMVQRITMPARSRCWSRVEQEASCAGRGIGMLINWSIALDLRVVAGLRYCISAWTIAELVLVSRSFLLIRGCSDLWCTELGQRLVAPRSMAWSDGIHLSDRWIYSNSLSIRNNYIKLQHISISSVVIHQLGGLTNRRAPETGFSCLIFARHYRNRHERLPGVFEWSERWHGMSGFSEII